MNQDEETPQAFAREFDRLYTELRQIAARELRAERPNHTLRATALVHEAYVRLSASPELHWVSRAHFLAIAAKNMRRVLLDYARSRGRVKRGGDPDRITLDEAQLVTRRDVDIEALDEALTRLEALDSRQSQIIEMRFFSGMSLDEIAGVLAISPKTIKRDWSMARAWLRLQIESGQSV